MFLYVYDRLESDLWSALQTAALCVFYHLLICTKNISVNSMRLQWHCDRQAEPTKGCMPSYVPPTAASVERRGGEWAPAQQQQSPQEQTPVAVSLQTYRQ